MDVEKILRLLESVEVESDLDTNDDENVTDNVEQQLESSDTEQDVFSDEYDSDDVSSRQYTGRDRKTIWEQTNSKSRSRTRAHNIVAEKPGVVGITKASKSPITCWGNFLSNDMLKDIATCTNKYIEAKQINYKRQRNARSTSEKEIKAVIGLLYFAGVFKSGRQNIYDLWNIDGTGVDIFHAKMSLARFKFLLQCIRFDVIETRNERKELNKLAPIREMFESFVANCKKAYCVSTYVTVDEKLEPFRGRFGFRQYISSKPA